MKLLGSGDWAGRVLFKFIKLKVPAVVCAIDLANRMGLCPCPLLSHFILLGWVCLISTRIIYTYESIWKGHLNSVKYQLLFVGYKC